MIFLLVLGKIAGIKVLIKMDVCTKICNSVESVDLRLVECKEKPEDELRQVHELLCLRRLASFVSSDTPDSRI